MKKISLFWIFSFLFCMYCFSENMIYKFSSDITENNKNLILFTAYRGKDNAETNSTQALHRLSKELNSMSLTNTVMIIIADNDILDLPDSIPVKEFRNTKKIISNVNAYETIAHFILEDGNRECVKLTYGAGKKTSPAWLLKDLYDELNKKDFSIDFKSKNAILYRAGILDDDFILANYLKEDIPSIKISTNADINEILKNLIETYANGIPKEWDRYYNTVNIFGLKIISEKILIIIILIIMFWALLYIFLFTFLFETERERNIKDFFKLWKVPIFLFIPGTVSLYISQYLVSFLFYLRFGDAGTINLFPITAFILKISFAGFSSSLFIIFNKLAKLPRNTFIYGYLVSLICFTNIFVFSNINLSFSVLFLEIYLLSFIDFQIKKPSLQIVFLILNFALLVHYFYPVFLVKQNIIPVLFYANNFLTEIFILPYNLMIIRIILQIKRADVKIKLPDFFLEICLGLISIICILVVLIAPFFLSEKNNFTVEKIEDNSAIVTENFFTVYSHTEKYLDRNICDVKVNPLRKALVIQVFVSKEDGFPLYESDSNFETSSDGKTAIFLSPISTKDPFSIKFSGEKEGELKIKVLAWFENSINDKTIFEAEKKFSLDLKSGAVK